MQLNTITPRHATRRPPPVGRGGKRGKTSGRGGKGQTARAGHKIRPEIRDLIKKIPKRRGWGRNRSRTVRSSRVQYLPISLSVLNTHFAAGDIVTPKMLRTKALVRGTGPIKVLGGEVTKAFTIEKMTISAAARAAVLKAGGTIHA